MDRLLRLPPKSPPPEGAKTTVNGVGPDNCETFTASEWLDKLRKRKAEGRASWW